MGTSKPNGDFTMRLLIASALVLLPVLAHGQAATLQAKATMPAGLHASAAAAKPAAPAAALTADDVIVPVNETVVNDNVAAENAVSNDLATPKLIKTTPIVLTLADMRAASNVNTVTVRVTVGKDGVPANLEVVQSAGSVIDRRAIEAISQYRFQPATQNSLPVESAVNVQIKVKKS